MEIMKDLMSLKAAFDIGFTKEENNFKKNKENFILSYELSDKINYAELKKSYFTFLSIFKFYYLPTHPSYLECLDRTLLHFVLLRNDSKKKIDPKLFNPFVIFLEFDPENSIDFRKRYGPGFDQKFLHSLISALKIAFTNYKTWREIDLNLFYNNLVTTLSALKKYYTWENDPIGLAKINNCFKVLKEEKTVNAGEVKDAIDAL